MENKYYEPKLEEFVIGLEYELAMIDNNWFTTGWDNKIVNIEFNYKVAKDYHSFYRVKYLDNQDLIELGWEVNDRSTELSVEAGVWRVRIISEGEIELDYDDNVDWEAGFTLYKCQVKNKSEMRKLMEMLNIKTACNKL